MNNSGKLQLLERKINEKLEPFKARLYFLQK